MVPKILIVDDDQSFRFVLHEALSKEGYQVESYDNAHAALARFEQERFEIVTVDIRMPDMDGMTLLSKMKQINPEQIVLIISAFGAQQIAVEAVQKGAYDYFTKPLEIEELRLVVRRALERISLGQENKSLRETLEQRYRFEEIIGNSGRMLEIFAVIRKVCETGVTVLVQGESGTGKELVARAVHYNSPRRHEPFVKVNCAAIPDTMLESELFGHEKGAFTDATFRKIGRFQSAHQGTIFLDEIGDMSLATQAKVLRVLQEKEFEPLGATRSEQVDVRIICATNKDLVQAVKAGEFREDLLYRINVVPIYLPALRDRREDIPLLLEHFLQRFNRQLNKNIRQISLEVIELLMKYNWPGNIRELENVLQRAIVLAERDIITKNELPIFIRSLDEMPRLDMPAVEFSRPLLAMVREIADNAEKQIIVRALQKSNWNRTDCARLLRISRKSLFNKMQRHGLTDPEG